MGDKRAFILHLFALVIVLGLLTHALEERARLMEPAPEPPEEEPHFIKQNTSWWQPPPPPLNISQVTVEHQGPL